MHFWRLGIKHLQLRIEDAQHADLQKIADKLFGGKLQQAGVAAILAFLQGHTSTSPDRNAADIPVHFWTALEHIDSQARGLAQSVAVLIKEHGDSADAALRKAEKSVAALKKSGHRIVQDASNVRRGRNSRADRTGERDAG